MCFYLKATPHRERRAAGEPIPFPAQINGCDSSLFIIFTARPGFIQRRDVKIIKSAMQWHIYLKALPTGKGEPQASQSLFPLK